MARVTGRLTDGKPIIDVTLADALPGPAAIDPSPPPSFTLTNYRALLDTGASITCICNRVVLERRLQAYGFVRMIGAQGPSLHHTYIVKLGIVCGDQGGSGEVERGLYQLEPLEAAAIQDNQWFDVIIGTDVLSNYEFALTKGGGFRLDLT